MARVGASPFSAGPADHAIAFHLYPVNALTDEKNITATISYDADAGLWTAQPGGREGALSEVIHHITGIVLPPRFDDLPPLHAAALLSAEDEPPLEKPRHEAAVRASMEQFEHIKRMLGESQVSMMVMGENGIAAYWSEGPHLLERLRQILGTDPGSPEAEWNTLYPEAKDAILSIAAGSADWAMESRLDEEYVLDYFENDPIVLEMVKHIHEIPEEANSPAAK